MSAGGPPGPHALRLFFALWPDDATRARLSAAADGVLDGVEGQRVPPGNYHVTLAFLGAVPGLRFAELVALGGRGPHPAVTLAFDRLTFWVRPKVLVAAATALPEAAVELVERLWRGLEPLGFEREQRTWQPHLTLVRRVQRLPEPLRPEGKALTWPPAAGWRLALVESTSHREGVRYKPLAEWALS